MDKLGNIWLIDKPFHGKQTLSVQFFVTDGDRMFAVYVGRNEEGQLIESVEEAFKTLWRRYAATED